MRHDFLSDGWFAKVDELIAAAGDLQVPAAMRVDVNVTVTRPPGDAVELFMHDGVFTRGHRASAVAKVTVPATIARKIFVEGDVAAGVQAFLSGEMQVDGDLAAVVAMQTIEPSAPQKALVGKIAEITA
jgi:hypothetical protein